MKWAIVGMLLLVASVAWAQEDVKEYYYANAINKTLAKGESDSTKAYQTSGWKHFAIWIRANCTGGGTAGNCDSIVFATYAVQIRGARTEFPDSTAAQPRGFWKRAVTPAGGGAPDTLGGFVATQYDSLRNQADPTSEFVVVLNVSREKSIPPYGRYIEISDPCSGQNFIAQRTQVRVRALDVYNANGVVFRSASPDNRTTVLLDVYGTR